MRILTVPMSNLESASLTVWVGVGSRFERDSQAGISHFLEHMVYKGTKKRPSPEVVSYDIDSIGAQANAGTSHEWTNFYLKARADLLETSFDILSDVVLHPRLAESEIEKERGVIIEEIAMKEDEPQEKIGDTFLNLIFAGSSLGRSIAGTKKTVKNIQRDDFINYTKMHYDAKNIILTVAGGVTEKRVENLAEKYFSYLRGTKKETPEKFKNTQKRAKVKLQYKKTEQAHLYFGFLGQERTHEDRFAESVLATILGRGFSSRLFTEVRERRGLAYAIGTSVSRFIDTGIFATYAGVRIDKLEEVIKILKEEHYKMTIPPAQGGKDAVGEKELQKAKDYIKGKMALSLENTLNVNDFFANQLLFLDKIRTPDEIFEKVDAVSADDVARVAKKIFTPKRLSLAILGPYKNEEKIKSLVNGNKSTWR